VTTAGFSDAFVVGGEFNVTPLAPVNGQKVPLQVDASGNLLVNVNSTITASENLAQVGGAAISLGAKTSALSLPVVLATDEANLPVVGAENSIVTQTWSSSSSPSLVVPCSGYGSVVVEITTNNGTFTQGVAQFFTTGPSTTPNLATGMRTSLNGSQLYDATNSLVLTTSQVVTYWFNCAGFDNVTVSLGLAIIGTGIVTLKGRAVAMPCPGPTTVGQSDATKLNVTNIAATTSNSSTTWSSATPNFTFFTINCLGYNTVIFDVIPDAGSVSAGQFGVYGQMPGGVNGTTLNYMRQLNNFDQLYDSPRLTNFVGLVTARYIVNCAGYQTVSLFLTQPISGTLTVSLRGAASMAVTPGPTTVGQADPTKLNASVLTLGTSSQIITTTVTSATPVSFVAVLPCVGYSTVVVNIQCSGGTFSAGQLAFYNQSASPGFRIPATGMRQVDGFEQLYDAASTFTLAPNKNLNYYFNVAGQAQFDVFLPVQITGSGTVVITVQATGASCAAPTTVGQSDPTKLNMTKATVASSFTVGSPAAATDFSTTISQAGVFQAMRFRYTASATAGNRFIQLVITDASNNAMYALELPFALTAGQLLDVIVGQGMPLTAAFPAVNGQATLPIPQIAVMPGWIIKSQCNFIAGDQISQIVYSLQSS